MKRNVAIALPGLIPPTRGATTITSSGAGSSTPGILTPSRTDYVTAAKRRLTLRDILPAKATDSNRIEWLKVAAPTPGASPQVEASAKAEQTLGLTIEYSNVQLYASWISASKQVLDDLPELERIVNQELLYDLKKVEEAELLTGSGTGVHLSGLVTNATAFETARIATSDNRLDYLRHAISQLAETDEEANFIVLNPSDFWAICGLKDDASGSSNIGRYLAVDPLSNQPMTAYSIWGIPTIVSTAMTSGTFLVGSSQMCQIFDRQAAVFEVSNSHDSYFTQNLIAMRLEERIAFAIFRAGAFVYGSLATASPI